MKADRFCKLWEFSKFNNSGTRVGVIEDGAAEAVAGKSCSKFNWADWVEAGVVGETRKGTIFTSGVADMDWGVGDGKTEGVADNSMAITSLMGNKLIVKIEAIVM